MTDIDNLLAKIGSAPVPVELSAIDDAVFAGVAKRQRETVLAPRLMGIAATLALGVGIVGGTLSGPAPALAQEISPFTSSSALAPSTLLEIRP